jgi:hypothetical protein
MSVHPRTNVMPGTQSRRQHIAAGVESANAGATQWAQATYDFAVDGGVIGNINLLGSTDIPVGAVILRALLDVITPPTSAGSTATIALTVESAGDLQAAAVVSGAPWSTVGRKSLTPQTPATSVKTTAARDIVAAIAVQNLTAGKFTVLLEYVDPTAN